ncbi:hypothetical protein BCR34DRAFT_594891 [Clohesyomyces aquaticus]|uniref:Uncharacterized protein n=1 Tax=Clohesyomyces aquaticus TaxID=1231657 RepID=A0A1Y1Y399_9PLEO|nr:hypothetical protein BCR34DRAFT_594891 [Clohesyomyces aquaticus]
MHQHSTHLSALRRTVHHLRRHRPTAPFLVSGIPGQQQAISGVAKQCQPSNLIMHHVGCLCVWVINGSVSLWNTTPLVLQKSEMPSLQNTCKSWHRYGLLLVIDITGQRSTGQPQPGFTANEEGYKYATRSSLDPKHVAMTDGVDLYQQTTQSDPYLSPP